MRQTSDCTCAAEFVDDARTMMRKNPAVTPDEVLEMMRAKALALLSSSPQSTVPTLKPGEPFVVLVVGVNGMQNDLNCQTCAIMERRGQKDLAWRSGHPPALQQSISWRSGLNVSASRLLKGIPIATPPLLLLMR